MPNWYIIFYSLFILTAQPSESLCRLTPAKMLVLGILNYVFTQSNQFKRYASGMTKRCGDNKKLFAFRQTNKLSELIQKSSPRSSGSAAVKTSVRPGRLGASKMLYFFLSPMDVRLGERIWNSRRGHDTWEGSVYVSLAADAFKWELNFETIHILVLAHGAPFRSFGAMCGRGLCFVLLKGRSGGDWGESCGVREAAFFAWGKSTTLLKIKMRLNHLDRGMHRARTVCVYMLAGLMQRLLL
jgi:hypothetical protein